MKTLSVYSRLAAFALFAALAGGSAYAQGYYDDDIYYDASKAEKEKKSAKNASGSGVANKARRDVQYYYDGAQYVPWNNVGDYQAADTYTVTGSSTRDVDEYNRRNVSGQPVEHTDSITLEQFEEMSNTRNLARFHNSQEAQAVCEANASDADYYGGGYAAPSQTVINLNVVDPYYYYSYARPWYWNSWGYYDPFWGPSWSYYPSWSWHWGWHGPGWAWGGPVWGGSYPGWGGGWVHPRPNYTSAGAFAPNVTNRGSRLNGTYRNGTSGRFSNSSRSSAAGSLGTRPSYRNGSVNRGTSGAAGTSRPGYRQPTTNPNGGNSSSGSSAVRGRRPSGSYGTPSNNSGSSTQRSNYNKNSNSNSSRNSYNYNSGSRGRSGSSSGSYGGSRGGSSRGSSGGHRGR